MKLLLGAMDGCIDVFLLVPGLLGWGIARAVEGEVGDMRLIGAASSSRECPSAALQGCGVLVIDVDAAEPDAVANLRDRTSARILALAGGTDAGRRDSAVLAGAHGVVDKLQSMDVLLHAVRTVHRGQIWLEGSAAARIMGVLRDRLSRPDGQHNVGALTRRERETIAVLVDEPRASTRAVAEKLCISEHTLRNHLTSIYGKLGLRNRVELFAFAHRHGLVTEDAGISRY